MNANRVSFDIDLPATRTRGAGNVETIAVEVIRGTSGKNPVTSESTGPDRGNEMWHVHVACEIMNRYQMKEEELLPRHMENLRKGRK